MNIVRSVEAARGCGYRSPGKTGVGIYLMGDQLMGVCLRLPFPLDICPCCGAGIKFSRSFTWIEPAKLFAPELDPTCDADARIDCGRCVMSGRLLDGRHGLIWIGRAHYTVREFVEEAKTRGVSRKLSGVPNGFKVGEHWVFLAHLDAANRLIAKPDGTQEVEQRAGVFIAFKPSRIDLVIDPDKPVPERAENIYKRIAEESGEDAVRLVEVVRDDSPRLFEEEE